MAVQQIILWKIKKRFYKKSDFVIVTPSKWLRDKVKKSMLSDKEVRLIYNGVDETVFHSMDKTEVRKELRLPVNKTILAFSSPEGLSNPWKGEDYLFNTLEDIKDDNIMFLNLGTSQSMDTKIINDIKWVSIPYVYEEIKMAEYFAASDLLIFPSIAENCPLVVLEAMACSTPVIAFNTGGVPELVDHLKTGYIAEYKDSDDLARGLELFLSDDDLREKAGIFARKRVEDKFTLNQQVDNYLKLYAQMLDKSDEKLVNRVIRDYERETERRYFEKNRLEDFKIRFQYLFL